MSSTCLKMQTCEYFSCSGIAAHDRLSSLMVMPRTDMVYVRGGSEFLSSF
jgi:hypothetical protein